MSYNRLFRLFGYHYQMLDLNNTYFDPKLELVKKFKLIGMPTTVLLDKDGNEFGRIMGEFNFNEKTFIDLLNKKINL